MYIYIILVRKNVSNDVIVSKIVYAIKRSVCLAYKRTDLIANVSIEFSICVGLVNENEQSGYNYVTFGHFRINE